MWDLRRVSHLSDPTREATDVMRRLPLAALRDIALARLAQDVAGFFPVVAGGEFLGWERRPGPEGAALAAARRIDAPATERPAPGRPSTSQGELRRRTAKVLELHASGRPVRRGLAESHHVEEAAAKRWMRELRDRGFLVRDDEGRYVPGPRFASSGEVSLEALLEPLLAIVSEFGIDDAEARVAAYIGHEAEPPKIAKRPKDLFTPAERVARHPSRRDPIVFAYVLRDLLEDAGRLDVLDEPRAPEIIARHLQAMEGPR